MKRKQLLIVGLVVAAVAIYIAQDRLQAAADRAAEAPMFEVDPFWPQPLPNHWVLGSVVGVGVDSRDHVFIVHRQAPLNERTEIGAAQDPPTGECCVPAPYVLEFDPEGNLVNSWAGPARGIPGRRPTTGSPSTRWTTSGSGATARTRTFSSSRATGSFSRLRRGGRRHAQQQQHQLLRARGQDLLRRAANEAYLPTATSTSAWPFWTSTPRTEAPGAPTATRPTTPAWAPTTPTRRCRSSSATRSTARIRRTTARVRLRRQANRIQVFRKDGTFVDEVRIAPRTLGDGFTWDIAFSRDSEQRYMYVADGKNMKVYVMDRLNLEVLTSFGDGGRQPGLFFAVHSIATDSQGNIYTTETYEGKRVQKFVYKGSGPVTAMNQGAPWPRNN